MASASIAISRIRIPDGKDVFIDVVPVACWNCTGCFLKGKGVEDLEMWPRLGRVNRKRLDFGFIEEISAEVSRVDNSPSVLEFISAVTNLLPLNLCPLGIRPPLRSGTEMLEDVGKKISNPCEESFIDKKGDVTPSVVG